MAQIVVLKRAHFFSIDNDIIDVHGPTIGIAGVGLYTALCRFANRQTGECWPAIGRLARMLDVARSTIKTLLRKLEAAGLIMITRRRDAAGDPTSNLYTLLDPSPSAVDKRLTRRTALAVPELEGGRPSANLPSVACQPTGRPPADPKPDLDPLTKETNQEEGANADEKTEQTPQYASTGVPVSTHPDRQPCPHPLEERSHFGKIDVCHHCWAMLDLHSISVSLEDPDAYKVDEPTASHAA